MNRNVMLSKFFPGGRRHVYMRRSLLKNSAKVGARRATYYLIREVISQINVRN